MLFSVTEGEAFVLSIGVAVSRAEEVFARGTGLRPNGSVGGALSGVYPNTQNWGLGMTVTFPLFDFASIRERKRIETFNERAEAARYDQIVQDLNGQMEQARAVLSAFQRPANSVRSSLEEMAERRPSKAYLDQR